MSLDDRPPSSPHSALERARLLKCYPFLGQRELENSDCGLIPAGLPEGHS